MKRTLLCLFIFICGYLSFPVLSSAHEIEEAGNLKVEIHISPNDHPLALQLSRIEIHVEDANHRFDFAKCNCVLEVQSGKTTLAELNIVGQGTTAETSYTFANDGEHTLILSGTTKESDDSFKSFSLTYTVEVGPVPVTNDPESQQTIKNTNMPVLQTSVAILSILLVVSVVVYIKKRSSHSDDPEA